MLWIKRNLFFALSVAVGGVLMLGAGYFLYSSMSANSAAGDDLKQARAELEAVQTKAPFPSKENIQLAKDQQQQVREMLAKFKTSLAPAQVAPKLDDTQFKELLDRTISQLQATATNNGVGMMPQYAFSFAAITSKLNFPAECVPSWVGQLQDIKVLCDILCGAKVNFLENVRRVPVSADEAVGGMDFLAAAVTTNDTTIRVPYELTIRAYSAELAATINGLMRSTNNLLIKNVDVAPTTSLSAGAMDAMANQAAQPTYSGRRTRSRGIVNSPTIQQPDPSLIQTGPITIASEGLLRVVIVVEIIKPKPPEIATPKPAEAKPAADASETPTGRRNRGAADATPVTQ